MGLILLKARLVTHMYVYNKRFQDLNPQDPNLTQKYFNRCALILLPKYNCRRLDGFSIDNMVPAQGI